MVCSERGVALVTILFLLALLMALAMLLTEKVWQSTRMEAKATNRQRATWAAGAVPGAPASTPTVHG